MNILKLVKPLKITLLLFLGIIIFSNLAVFRTSGLELSNPLGESFSERCLSPELAQRPVWECYEILTTTPVHTEVVIQHESGLRHRVLTFEENGQTKFRFTPTQLGRWTFSTGGFLDINRARPDYAKGFVEAQGTTWIRTATTEPFIPQFVIYNKADLDAGLDEFVNVHGFTGFHIANLRDFLENPDYFEAVVLKTYRRGGSTHFWIWGDRSRQITPDTYGVDVDRLYTEIAARLGPIPGWTLGYGFDLWEWATADEVETFQRTLQELTSYHHMVGGRGYKNQYREISSNLDYVSWEWHRPTYDDYRDHIEQANGRPVFSEDRFRIRTPSRYPEKDYDIEMTLRGLWDSAIAGGVANIWGYQPKGAEFSEPYLNKTAIRTYRDFIDKTFTSDMQPDPNIIDKGHCLRDNQKIAICYAEAVDRVSIDLSQIEFPAQIVAVDTRSVYEEIEIPYPNNKNLDWLAPYRSDWAFQIISQDYDRS